MGYQLQPGTIPARAHAHLLSLGPGAELATAVLADALDHDSTSLTAALAVPRLAGVFNVRPRPDGGRGLVWSIGAGQPVKPAIDDDEDDDEDAPAAPVVVTVVAEKPVRREPKPFRREPKAPVGATKAPVTATKPARAETPPTLSPASPLVRTRTWDASLRYFEWPTGEIHVEKAGQVITFERDEFRLLMGFGARALGDAS